MTSLDSINGWSNQTLLRGENDSKQSDEFQAISSTHVFFCIIILVYLFSLLNVLCNGPFMASKAKNMHQRCTFLGGGGGGQWNEGMRERYCTVYPA